MTECEKCFKNPKHPDKKCCFNCVKDNRKCHIFHYCGKDCPKWESVENHTITKEETTEYRSIFKCRLCGKQYESGGMCNNLDLVVNETIRRCIGIACKEPQTPSMTEVHLCGNGNIGIADFQGWEKRYYNAKKN